MEGVEGEWEEGREGEGGGEKEAMRNERVEHKARVREKLKIFIRSFFFFK